ncbi:unnamed protein product [Paramecium pentaurelia]|uniref:PSI domain-containing protein n=1 Tax=Paramecium pentaurelia TaxID=43138 RepID=A0A8S1SNT6_9CILI|nr:unnamed protein product [Paramecium pentaurelia]
MGCNPNLSQKLCIKQFGNMDGTTSECIFDTFCHTIYDKYTTRCSNKLSKSGCLSITNPDELCKWENGQCQNLSIEETKNINQVFQDLELSASVCSRISGYLIIHSTLLWDLLSYKSDLFTEAQNLVKVEAGITVDTTKIYEDQKLGDNYIDNNGDYKWYTTPTQLSITNLKINDYSRYGCIAQEILNESRFLTLFSLSGIIRGVNHIYCNYLSKHPTNPVKTVFTNYECQQITDIQLQDQQYIDQNQIVCQSMSGMVCQRYLNVNQKCQINYYKEYECYNIKTIQVQQQCNSLISLATHFDCSQVKGSACYLDYSNQKAECSQICVQYKTKINCENDTRCVWLGSNLFNLIDSSNSIFIVCAPINKCDQLGLNQDLCELMATPCYWDINLGRCKTIKNIEQMKCQNCNTIFCCTSIIMFDQFCIWHQNNCLNVKDQKLYSHYLSFPETTLMNYNLCVSQSGKYYYYNIEQQKCESSQVNLYSPCVDFEDQNYDVDDYVCNNGVNDRINKEYCLNLINSNTRWDYFKQKCLHVTNTHKSCNLMKLVNPNLCKEAIVLDNKLCLYDSQSSTCYYKDASVLHCDTKGINQVQCLSITNEYCAWMDNQCIYLQPSKINYYNCYELQKVSPSVCRLSIYQSIQCKYDEDSKSCIISYINISNCDQYANSYACRMSSSLCYYNNVIKQCQDSTPFLNQFNCNTEFISQSTCMGITKPGQYCFWGSINSDQTIKCRNHEKGFYSNCNTFDGYSNANICVNLTTNIALNLSDQQYCEVVDNVCTSLVTEINDIDCGYTRQMNVYRCMGYTTEQCYFQNQKCTILNGPQEYQDIILNQLLCQNSNMQICTKITTPGQVCYKQNTHKCISMYLSFGDNCENLSLLDMTIYNPQLCTHSTDACYYDKITNKCKIPELNDIFDCDQIGASQILCLLQTRGSCVFVNNKCSKLIDYTISCDYRNRMGCTYGELNCVWDQNNKQCKLSTELCPQSYEDIKSWRICGISSGICFAGRNGCSSEQVTVPCWLSLRYDLCISQPGYCQWIDDRCTDKEYDCEDSKTIQECTSHKTKTCVYDKGQCFEIINFQNYDCNDFQYTTLNFCWHYYPLCVYKDNTCQMINYNAKSDMIDEDFAQYQCSSLTQTQYGCALQRAMPCQFQDQIWFQYCSSIYTWQLNTCDYFDQTEVRSFLACESIENCGFKMTLKGEIFCHTIPLQCETLTPFCVNDIPGINCYLDNDVCLTYTGELTCSAVASYQVNRQLCISIMQNELNTEECYYQESTNKCKKRNTIEISDCTQYTELYQCTFVEESCLIVLDLDGVFQQCNISQNNTYDINLNYYGCIQLTGNLYYFDLNLQTCLIYDESKYNSIYICNQLNQQSCIQILNDLKCVWVNEKCEEYIRSYEQIDCQFKNRQTCINSIQSPCIWIGDNYECDISDNIGNQCNDGTYSNCQYSENYCKSISQLWNGVTCYDYSSNLPYSFIRCNRLGLSRSLCLENTAELTCFWDGQNCLEANLKTINCTDDVSFQTCEQILTYNQICKWDNGQCINKVNSQNCNDYITWTYCKQAIIPCSYNLGTNTCDQLIEVDQSCSDTLSYSACQKVINQFCSWINNTCQKWYRSKYSCENLANQWGCLNTSMFCTWNGKCENIGKDFQLVSCQDIPSGFNKVSCSKYSMEPCKYDDVTQKCNIKLTSEYTNSMQTDQSNFIQIRLIYECTQFQQKDDCIGSRIGYCQWQNNICINCSTSNICNNSTCFNNSIKQCLSISNVQCAWRNDQCVDWQTDENVTQTQLSLVTEICCTTLNMAIKYDQNLSSCIPLDLKLDNCNSKGLSKYACLKLINAPCIYYNNQCSLYQLLIKPNCSDYKDVTQSVCQMIQHLSCKYDSITNTCKDINTNSDTCNTLGLSLNGCTNIKTEACYWNINTKSCQNFIIKKGINQCDNQTQLNSLSCSQLNYHNNVCSYNVENRTCQEKFNKYFNCTYPGLNKMACVSLILEPCQYVDNKCQKIMSLKKSCLELSNVNEIACKMNTLDSCAYDPISNNCYFTLQQLPCNYHGLNYNNCVHQTNCKWSYDITQCICSIQQPKTQCQLTEINCKSNTNCIYDYDIDNCRLKNCNDLNECIGSINGKVCYKDAQQQCLNASQCEDIINLNNLSNCTDFVFNSSNCIQILNHCISASNLKELCPNSDCSNTACKYDNFQCRPLTCVDRNEEDCYNYSNCIYLDNQCQEISTCSTITDSTICIQTTINKFKCSWEMYGVYENTYHCTNTYCHLYNASPTLCNGNEINDYSCIMDQFLQCKTCESITDECTCLNSNGSCFYSNGKCNSILCQSFLTETTCTNSNKCYWSFQDKVCRKFCKQLILQQDCEALDYECHWNLYQYKCEQGIAVVPDLSVKINVQDIHGELISYLILILILII